MAQVDLFRLIDDIRLEAVARGDAILHDLAVPVDDPRSAAFNRLIKNAVITLELLDHYRRMWIAPPRDLIEEQERAERLMMLFREMLFVASISALEFSSRQVLQFKPGSALTQQAEAVRMRRRNQRLYFSDIINVSVALGLVSQQDGDDWQAILKVRNIVVHSNGIADEDADHQVGSVKIELRSGQMTRGPIDFFPRLTREAMSRYETWVRAVSAPQ